MKTLEWLKSKRKLLIDIINELVEEGFYTETDLAIIFGTNRQRVSSIRKGKAVILREDTIEIYLDKLGQGAKK